MTNRILTELSEEQYRHILEMIKDADFYNTEATYQIFFDLIDYDQIPMQAQNDAILEFGSELPSNFHNWYDDNLSDEVIDKLVLYWRNYLTFDQVRRIVNEFLFLNNRTTLRNDIRSYQWNIEHTEEENRWFTDNPDIFETDVDPRIVQNQAAIARSRNNIERETKLYQLDNVVLEYLRSIDVQYGYFDDDTYELRNQPPTNRWIDRRTRRYRAHTGRIELNTDTFESAAVSNVADSEAIFKIIQNARYRFDPNTEDPREPDNWLASSLSGKPRKIYSNYGWSKYQLREAILAAGLEVEREFRFNAWGRHETRGIPLSAIGLVSRRERGIPNQTIYLPGINSRSLYLPKSLYEALFRRVYGLGVARGFELDWSKQCNNEYMTENYIRDQAINVYHVDPALLQGGRRDLCLTLANILRERTAQRSGLARESREINTAFYYQPGSRLIQPQSERWTYTPRVQLNVPDEWIQLENACLDSERFPKEQLMEQAEYLGIPVAITDTREMICSKIRRVITILRQAK